MGRKVGQAAKVMGTGGEAVGHQLERVGMPAEAAMCELAAELKEAEAVQPLAAMRMLGELACMDEHDELQQLCGDRQAV